MGRNRDMRRGKLNRKFSRVVAAAIVSLGCSCSEAAERNGSAHGNDGGPSTTNTQPLDASSADRASTAADSSNDGGKNLAADGGIPLDASADAGPAAYVPDRVTMGLDLPTVMPVLRIDVGGQIIEKDVELQGRLEVFESHAGTLTDLDTVTATLSTAIGFEGRGNFTWVALPKKGYAFELQDGTGKSVDLSILGLPAGSDFALYACYTDKTCMRNALVYALGQELGYWSPRTRYVELIIDGTYLGLYMVWERIRRDATRCDVAPVAANATVGDLTGGYIFRVEGGKGSETVGTTTYPRDFSVSSGRKYTYHSPDADKVTAEQATYLHDFMQAFEDSMQTTPTAYATWIDVASWVDRGIVEELTNNWDGYVHSVYITKDQESEAGLLHMGPLWDFDLAFANGDAGRASHSCKTDVWAHDIGRPAPDDVAPYWLALFADAGFQHAFKCRFEALRKGPLSLATFDARIAAWKSFTESARARDQAKWPTVGKLIFPNCFSKPTYDEEVSALRDWISARLSWLDTQAAMTPGSCP